MPQISGKQLNVNNLQHIHGGRVAQAINHEMRNAIRDCVERPGDKGKRCVVIKMDFTPVLDESTAALDVVNAQFNVTSKLPARVSKAYPMLATAEEGCLQFQPESPNDPRQASLPYTEQEDALPPEETQQTELPGHP